jgi:hypothetical protein
MDIETFAAKNRLKTTLSDCGELVVEGRHGQIYEYSDTELGVLFMMRKTQEDPWGRWCPKIWGNIQRAGLAVGMTVRQNAASEGALSFDPMDKVQVKLAIKIAKVRAKKQISEEQKARLVATLREFRARPSIEHTLAF